MKKAISDKNQFIFQPSTVLPLFLPRAVYTVIKKLLYFVIIRDYQKPEHSFAKERKNEMAVSHFVNVMFWDNWHFLDLFSKKNLYKFFISF